ncbi:SDR family oxidoreductase [Dictyobacter aurantiacus]|uniref:Short-chain dehydrogenase/reductase n=1 Tax=Dictyobacter aurantiacus TaxID=1936993 RepID=A0A401ZK90_9CHLR|nr:SDR family oxidoreductase [Dictyobacter aurantiacus]GCE07234.1 short-chain dehydrogenase/reductase [Dictyobacter aurantiacus]
MSTTQNKIALVTGTSSGIGLSTAVRLAQHGYTVVATMRDPRKSHELEEQARQASVSLDVRPLDVEDATSITACVQEIIQTYGHIDLLVNNAGAGFLGTMEQTSEQDLRRTMEINFFGVWRVTQAVFPAMRAARSGRIITVTSVGGIIGQPFNDAYCAAKFATEGMMEALAPVARRLGIDVSIIEPGPVNTNFVASVRAQLPEQTPEVKESYSSMIEAYMGGSQERFASLGQTPEQIAQVIVEVATVEQPHFRYATSELVRNLVTQKYADPSGDNMVALFSSRLG